MKLNRFIENNGIREADAIIVRKEKLGLFDHYVIFLGYDRRTGKPEFIANYRNGVEILPTNELYEFLRSYKPVSIRKFKGTEQQRQYAIQRAKQDLRMGSSIAYHLIKNNCEHFASWVQTGVRESKQVKDFGKGAAVGGLGLTIAGLASKDADLIFGGLLLTLLGGITNALGDD
jgi:hypothetical protein